MSIVVFYFHLIYFPTYSRHLTFIFVIKILNKLTELFHSFTARHIYKILCVMCRDGLKNH